MSSRYLPNMLELDILEPQLCSRGSWQRADKANSPLWEASALMGMLLQSFILFQEKKNDSDVFLYNMMVNGLCMHADTRLYWRQRTRSYRFNL